MRFEFHPEALAEYTDAGRFYADRQAGLELRFMDCVEEAIRRAAVCSEFRLQAVRGRVNAELQAFSASAGAHGNRASIWTAVASTPLSTVE